MNKKLTGPEIIELLRVAHNALKMIHGADSLAGVILTNESFDQVRRTFGPDARPYNPTGVLAADPAMQDVFVVDGMLILRGTSPIQ